MLKHGLPQSLIAGLLGVAGVAFLALSTASVYEGILSERGIRQDADRDAEHYAREAHQRVWDSCLILPDEAKAECVREATETAREKQRNERDLEAQQVVAVWTSVIGRMTVVGVVLSAFGIFLVYVTFRQAQRAADLAGRMNEIAEDTGRVQQRPWLNVELNISRRFRLGRDDECITSEVQAVFSNTGATPAVDIFYRWEVNISSGGHVQSLRRVASELREHIAAVDQRRAGEIIFVGGRLTRRLVIVISRDEIESSLSLIRHGILMPWVCLVVMYRDRHRDRWYQTAKTIEVMQVHASGEMTFIAGPYAQMTTIDVAAVPTGVGIIE